LEFAYFGEDFGEAVCKPVEARAFTADWERASEDLYHMLGRKQGVDKAIEAFSHIGG
jgi:hypothetical protein